MSNNPNYYQPGYQNPPYANQPYGQPYGQPPPQPYTQPYAQPYGAPQPQPYNAQPYVAQPSYGEPAYTSAPVHTESTSLTSAAEGSSKVKFPEDYSWRDLPFAILFVLHLGGIVALFAAGLSKFNSQSSDEQDDNTDVIPLDKSNQLSTMFGICVICAAVGILFSSIYLSIVKKFAKQLIIGTLIANIVFWFAIAILLFAVGSIGGGIITLVVAALNALCFYWWRARIPFATAMLKTVSGVVEDFPATTYTAYFSLVVLFAWTIFWIATCAFAQSIGSSGLLAFFLLLSFYWTSQVIKNVVHVTVAGTFASWYFLKASGMPHNPTLGSFKRATTTSFGSICLGSLIVAILKTLRTIVDGLRRQKDNILTCILSCILSCIERLVEYFNMYAYTQVAIYGKTYCQAAKDTYQLIKTHGVMAIINDNLISNVLLMGAFLGGAITAVVGGFTGYLWVEDYWAALAVVGFIIGFVLVSVTMEVVESGVACIFVCFAMDPQALKRSDPYLFQKFYDTYGSHLSFA